MDNQNCVYVLYIYTWACFCSSENSSGFRQNDDAIRTDMEALNIFPFLVSCSALPSCPLSFASCDLHVVIIFKGPLTEYCNEWMNEWEHGTHSMLRLLGVT